MKKLLLAVLISSVPLAMAAELPKVVVKETVVVQSPADKTVNEAPRTKKVCYTKDGKPAEPGTKDAVCKTIRVHKMYDGVKIPTDNKK